MLECSALEGRLVLASIKDLMLRGRHGPLQQHSMTHLLPRLASGHACVIPQKLVFVPILQVPLDSGHVV